MRFNVEDTRWLGVYLETGLQFRAHNNISLKKAKRAVDNIGRLGPMHGIEPSLIRRIQVAAVLAVTLSETEI